MNAFISHKRSGELSIFTFNTNVTYEMPVALLTSDINQFQNTLTFAAKLIEYERSLSDEYVKGTIFTDYIKKLEEKHSSELITLEKSHSSEITSRLSDIIQSLSDKEIYYSDQIRQLRLEYDQQIKTLKKDKQKVEDDATATKIELENIFEKEIKTLRKQLTDKEIDLQSVSKNDMIIREECNSASEKMIKLIEAKHSQALQALRESYEVSMKLKDESIEQRESRISLRENEFEKKQLRNANSSLRGKDGENSFNELIELKTSWKLIDTSKIPRSCDFSSVIHNAKVFFEVKKYKDTVGSSEVTKFTRDMKENPDVIIGIFISHQSGIVNKEIPISIEWINTSQCAVYIQRFNELDIDATLALLDHLIKIVGIYNKLISSNNIESKDCVLQNAIDKSRVYIERYLASSIELIKSVTNDKKKHLKIVEESYSNTLTCLKSQGEMIRIALEILTGEYIEDTNIDESIASEISDPKKTMKKKK
jgi:hypothetical protein